MLATDRATATTPLIIQINNFEAACLILATGRLVAGYIKASMA